VPDTHSLALIDLLRHDAFHYADKAALRIDGVAVTYAELERRVDAVARALARHVQPGDRVGLWLQNSFAWVASFLACNALGAVSVPVNTRLTAPECRSILRDAQARVVITTRHYRGRDYLDELFAAAGGPDAGLLAIAASDDAAPSDWPVSSVAGEAPPRAANIADMLCIQYTSGTTASPKGVLLTNRAYLQTAAYVARCQRLTPSSRFISAAPFFHCSGTMHAITVCLTAGCTLNAFSAWDPERFLDETQRQRCDVSHMIYFRDVLALSAERARPKLATMKVAHDLGTPEYLRRLHDELGLAGISNIYGMTETAGQFTMWFPDDPLEQRLSANGRPQPGNRVRIGAPDTGEPLGPGAVGEIQMKGLTVTPGYFNRPEANAEAFTRDGWLRSGDLGTVGEDGTLRYIARLKELIRVGGENLAPAEVEQAIRDATGMQHVCVLGVPDARLDEVPAAVIVGASDADWPQVLRELRATLSGFKIPKAVYQAPQFPLTATNRVQRAVLRDWIVSGKLERVA
jgi:acyl-CoA synthetase (AMP-forming)/AMP-acid ligase II